MRRHLAQANIRPKISTMPRQKTEAAAFLDIYKLVIEKKRLQQELQTMDERRLQIQKRLVVLESQVSGLEQSVQHMRDEEANPTPPQAKAAIAPPASGTFDMEFLDY
jgi:chromosome segregation ATPase